MKLRRLFAARLSFSLASALLALLATPSANAAILTWDNGAASGNWNTTEFNWSSLVIPWSNATPDDAIFGATGVVTVTLTEAITAGSVTINTAGYTITGNTITLNSGATALTSNATSAVNSNVTLATAAGTITSSVGILSLGGTVDAGSLALTFAGAGDATLSSAIANGTTLTKTGAGVLTLAGSNGFTSATISGGTITGGTLALSGGVTALTSSATSAVNSNLTISTAAGTITSSAGTLTLGGTLDAGSLALTFDGVGNTTVNNAIANGDSLIKSGTGTLTLLGSNGFAGATIISSAGALANNALTVSNTSALGTTAGGTTLFGSNTTGNGTQLVLANGITVTDETLTMDPTVNGYRASLITAGTAVWDGNVVVDGSGGVLAFNTNGASSNLTVGSVDNADTVTGSNGLLLRGTGTGTVNSTLSHAGVVNKTDAGIWTLTAANTYTGSTTVSNGTLSINSIKNVGEPSSALGAPLLADATIKLGTTNTTGILVYTGAVNMTDRVIDLAGTTGGATLTQSGGSGLLKFTSSFTATGDGGKILTLNGSLGGTGEISGAIVNNGASDTTTNSVAFVSNASSITVASTAGYTNNSRISGTGLATGTTITAINTGTGALTLSNNTIAAGAIGVPLTITASTAVTKAGTGNWTLSGTNTYTGTTRIDGGVLRIDQGAALPGGIGATGGTSYLLFNSGGVLGLGGTGTQPNFNRSHGAGLANGFYFQSNGGFAAYDQDRVVNVGGANATITWLNGKTIILGHSTSTHKVRISNGFNITTVTRPLQVDNGSGAVDGELSGVISHNAGAFAGVDKTGLGTVAFTGNSLFFGSLVVRSGTVIVNKVTNSGTASPIGQGTSGFTLAGGTFQYAPVSGVGGGAATANRNFGIAASSSLDASGTGALVLNNPAIISPDEATLSGTWTATANPNITGLASTANLAIGMKISGAGIPAGATITQILTSSSISMSGTPTAAGSTTPVTFGYPSARTLTLTGTNADDNTLAGILQDSSAISAGVLSLTKAGTGNWNLTGVNTYTGPTSVTGGRLTVSGSGTLGASTGFSVSGGATFNYLPTTVGTPLTLGALSTLNLSDGATLGLSWDASAASSIAALDAATVGTGVGLNMSGSFTSGTTYTVLTAASGLNAGSYFVFNPSNYTAVIAQNPGSVTITPTIATPLATAFWNGGLAGFTNVWAVSDGLANSNWVTAAGGGATGLVPGADTDVVISATAPLTPPTATVLGANMSVNSLTLADVTNGMILNADGNTLSINPSAPTTGITMNATVPASSIAAKVDLSADQTWTNDSVNPLTVSGVVSGAFQLTKTGTGPIILSGLNSLTGNVVVSAGTLSANAGVNALNSTLSALGDPQAAGRTITVGPSGTLSFGVSDALGNANSNPVVKIINNGGIITNSGNFFTTLGPVDLNAGTLTSIGGNSANYPSFNLRGTVTVGGGAVSTISNTGTNSQIGLASGTGTTFDVADVVTGSASDLDVTATLANINFVAGVLIKEGVGTMTLSGPNAYTGATTVNAGTLTLGNASAVGTGAAAIATVNGGSLDLGGQAITNAVVVNALGTLTGSGAVGAATLAGNVTPGGASTGLITAASATVATTSAITLQLPATGIPGTNYDAITVSAPLALDGTITVNISGLTPTIGQTFDIINSTGPINVASFTVATDLILPPLGAGLAWNTSAFASDGIISIVSPTPYDVWALTKGLDGTIGKENGKNDDPDKDGRTNLDEFAFDGDPLSGANDGKIVGKIATVGLDNVMTLTLPVRTGATFAASSGDQLSALIDGIYYRIEGDKTLGTFADNIVPVSPAIIAGLPTPLSDIDGDTIPDWTYRTFTFAAPDTVPTVPKAFLRANATVTP